MINSNGNHVWVLGGGVRATIYQTRDGRWGGIWNGAADGKARRLKGTFDDAEDAVLAIELADQQGEHSARWHTPDDQWKKRKAGGYYKKVKGTIVSVKQAKSGSWYAATMNGAFLGQDGDPTWFNTAEEAVRAVEARLAGSVDYAWISRQ